MARRRVEGGAARADEPGAPLAGVMTGVVKDNRDPEGLGRVKLAIAGVSKEESAWARVATPMAGNRRGAYFLPEIGDEVLVAFEGGDTRAPYVLGALWGKGRSRPPETNEDGANNRRTIRSRSGHVIRLDDTEGAERIEIVDSSGRSSIVIDSAGGTITIEAQGDLTIAAATGTLRLRGARIEIEAAASLTAHGAQVEVEGDAVTRVKGGLVTIN
jgi:uncharacterized protein involved in type VI secretion and phage assembly